MEGSAAMLAHGQVRAEVDERIGFEGITKVKTPNRTWERMNEGHQKKAEEPLERASSGRLT